MNNAYRRDAYLGHRLYPWVFLASFSRVLRVTENVRVVFLTRTNKVYYCLCGEAIQIDFSVVTKKDENEKDDEGKIQK